MPSRTSSARDSSKAPRWSSTAGGPASIRDAYRASESSSSSISRPVHSRRSTSTCLRIANKRDIKMTKRLLLGMAGAAILAFSPGAAAAGIISLVPSHSTVTAGDIFQVDLIATDLQIGGYDLILGYNPLLGLIEESGVLFDSSLGGPDDSFTFLFPGLDSLELGEVSLLTSPADLAARQSSLSFPLAHLTVTALSAGTLNFDFVSALYTG